MQKIKKVLETVSLLTTIMANVMLVVFGIVVVLRPITRLKERLRDLEQLDFSDWEG